MRDEDRIHYFLGAGLQVAGMQALLPAVEVVAAWGNGQWWQVHIYPSATGATCACRCGCANEVPGPLSPRCARCQTAAHDAVHFACAKQWGSGCVFNRNGDHHCGRGPSEHAGCACACGATPPTAGGAAEGEVSAAEVQEVIRLAITSRHGWPPESERAAKALLARYRITRKPTTGGR